MNLGVYWPYKSGGMEMGSYRKDLSREELIKLVERISLAEGTEKELESMMALFDANVPHPNGSNLIFYPEDYNARTFVTSSYNPTPEEIVEKALSYRPLLTPPPNNPS